MVLACPFVSCIISCNSSSSFSESSIAMIVFSNIPWSSNFVYLWLQDDEVLRDTTFLEASELTRVLLMRSWIFYNFKAYNSKIHFVNKFWVFCKDHGPAGCILLNPGLASELGLALSCLASRALWLSCLPLKYCMSKQLCLQSAFDVTVRWSLS